MLEIVRTGIENRSEAFKTDSIDHKRAWQERVAKVQAGLISGEFSKRELQILLAVFLNSLNINRSYAEVTRQQLVAKTGIPLNYVSAHLKSLALRGVLICEAGPFGRLALNQAYFAK